RRNRAASSTFAWTCSRWSSNRWPRPRLRARVRRRIAEATRQRKTAPSAPFFFLRVIFSLLRERSRARTQHLVAVDRGVRVDALGALRVSLRRQAATRDDLFFDVGGLRGIRARLGQRARAEDAGGGQREKQSGHSGPFGVGEKPHFTARQRQRVGLRRVSNTPP